MPPLLDLKNICFKRNGKLILHNVDMSIHKGQIVTLIGPNGAGKSTLLEIAIGLQQADSGSVERKADLKVAYVPQKLAVDPIMPLSVERLMQLTQKAIPAEIDHALNRTKAIHLKKQMVSELSGGELQRVLLARAIVRRPDLLVLDEPAQGVDFAGQSDLYALIEQVRDEDQCGVLLISHDIHVVMSATDHVICLNKHICCAGRPEKVTHDPEYLALFGRTGIGNVMVYNHHHDHAHDLDGKIVNVGDNDGHVHGPNCTHN